VIAAVGVGVGAKVLTGSLVWKAFSEPPFGSRTKISRIIKIAKTANVFFLFISYNIIDL